MKFLFFLPLLAPTVAAFGGTATTSVGFTTFNAGLLGAVPLEAERRAMMQDTLAPVLAASDVVCLQELWRTSDQQATYSVLESELPHVLTVADLAGSGTFEPACDADKLTALLTCVTSVCLGAVLSNDLAAVLQCASLDCGTELFDAYDERPTCATCILFQAASFGISAGAACAVESDLDWTSNSGLMLASRYPLSDTSVDVLSMSSQGLVGLTTLVLSATVETPAGPMRVSCTHLEARSDPDVLTGTEDQFINLAQITALLSLPVPEGIPSVLLGDFNTGPGLEGVDAQWLDNYEVLVAGGDGGEYLNPALDHLPLCTYCKSENELVRSHPTNAMIDLILFRGLADSAVFSAERIFDVPHPDYDGLLESDHFGVMVWVHV